MTVSGTGDLINLITMIDAFLNDNILTKEQDVTRVGFSESISGSKKFIPDR